MMKCDAWLVECEYVDMEKCVCTLSDGERADCCPRNKTFDYKFGVKEKK